MIDYSYRRFNLIFRSTARLLVIVGFIVLIGSSLLFLINPALTFFIQIGASVGIMLILLAIMLRPHAVHLALTGRPVRYASNLTVICSAFVTILVIANFLSFKNNFEFDLTETREFTLSEQTIAVLEGLTEPVQVVGFFSTDDQRWAKTKEYLERYRRYTDLITYGLHDPNTEPTLAQSYGLKSYGLVFVSGVYGYESSKVNEQAITTGLMCVTTHRHNQNNLDLVSFETKHPNNRHFSLTPVQAGLIFFITSIFIPLIALIAGLRVWWLRR